MSDGPQDAPVPVATEQNYRNVLRRIHDFRKPEWYLEIGTSTGKSLAQSRGKAIAVDPNFRLADMGRDLLAGREQLHLFQMTSDAFFGTGLAETLAARVDFAFLDGLHLFEFLLRDLINTERLCDAQSVIAIHDVVPITNIGAEREWNRKKTTVWTGDVWKIIPVLREYRPDLDLNVVNCRPTGLALIGNPDPKNTVLEENYEEIVAKYVEMSINDFGRDALAGALTMTSQSDPSLARYIGPAA